MKNIYTSLTCLVLFIVVLGACSEDTVDTTGVGNITGTVVMEGDNEPIENVKISTSPPSNTVFTDENGEFDLGEVPTGEYSVQADKNELITAFEPANVTQGATTNVIFELLPESANNRPPNTPILVAPEDNATEVSQTAILTWIGSDPDELDELTYKVTLRNDMTSEILEFENVADTTLTVSDLSFATKYFWQVAANDGVNVDDVNSEVSSFTTVRSPNNRVFFTRKIGLNNVIYSAGDGESPEVLRLTPTSVNSYRPRLNNAVQKVAFLRSVGAETHLFTMDDDGSNERQITTSVSVGAFNYDEVDFSWEPNGERLFFPSFDKLYAIDQDGSGLEIIYQTTDGSFITEIDHALFDDILAVKTNDVDGYNVSIFTIDLMGNLQTMILSGVPGAAGGINISANADRLVYAYDVSGFENPDYRQLDTRLFIYNFASATTADVSDSKPAGTNDLDPRFSPSDAEIIFVNTSNDGISQRNLNTVNLTSSPTRLSLIENAFMPDWE